MKDDTLLIFVKNAVKGKVKTRLAKTIGNDKAVEIYKRLLTYTASITKGLSVNKIVYYKEWIEKDDVFDPQLFDKALQTKGDLGDKMKKAFENAFEGGASNIVIIGSDCPEINEGLLRQAFYKLKENDIVIGPALDGGYYLLGMSTFFPFLFEDKAWSTSSVFADTIADCKSHNLKFDILPKLRDLDTEKDYQTLKKLF